MKIARRTFLKASVGGAAGISLAGSGAGTLLAAPRQQGATWQGGGAINPEISDLRVVCYHDPEMCEMFSDSNFEATNRAVDNDKVGLGMDKMAMQLAQKGTPAEAWKTIFRSGRAWSESKAAFKVNSANASNMPRAAILKKIADVLIGFGMSPENIVVYDGHGDAGRSGKYTTCCDVNDESKVRARVGTKFTALGGTQACTLAGASSTVGPRDLVSGEIDVLVNIAVHRGHNMSFNGNVTLCLKNHYGTFVNPATGNADNMHQKESFIGVNKHELVTGGDPIRQQLCIVDSLFAAKTGPFENGPDSKLDRIVMGTFAGAVDYCTVKKIRESVQKWTHNDATIATFLTDYGFREGDVQYIEITPTAIRSEMIDPVATVNVLTLTIKQATLRFSLPVSTKPVTLQVFDIKGSLLCQITCTDTSKPIVWDGMTGSGRRISAGSYLVSVSSGSYRTAQPVIFIR